MKNFCLLLICGQLVGPYALASHGGLLTGDQLKNIRIAPGVTRQLKSGEDVILGDSSVGDKDARKSWLKKCATWQAKVKADLNKSEIIVLNCGRPKCITSKTSLTCSSRGKYSYEMDTSAPSKKNNKSRK